MGARGGFFQAGSLSGWILGLSALCASLALASCAESSGGNPTPTPTAAASQTPAPVHASATPASASPSASPRPSASPTQATAPSLLDVNGRWCPTSPAESGESCYVIDLPEVRVEGDDDPSHLTYVYTWDSKEEDPREFTDDTYGSGPESGECWSAAVDSYPGWSGAAFYYCPAGAVAGEDWIDDPVNFAFSVAADTVIGDYTGQDRVYMTQELTPYPYVRSGG